MKSRLFQAKAREWFRRASALDRLRAFTGLGDMPHGLRTSSRLSFPHREIARRTWLSPLRRVRLSDLLTTQDDVGPEDVERHVRDARLVPVGRRGSSGANVDHPIVVRMSDGLLYVWDGHHRLAAEVLKGHTEAWVRYVDMGHGG